MNATATKRLPLIIGYGNPLRGDDAVGRLAADHFEERYQGKANVVSCHQLTPELAMPISQASLAIFVDAATGGCPGRLKCEAIEPHDGDAAHVMTHDVTPQSLLAAAQVLYDRRPPAYMITIDGQFWGYREGLSEDLSDAIEQAVEKMNHLIALPRAPER